MVLQTSDCDFNLYLRPDTNTKGYCNWFYFRITRTNRAAVSLRFNILNMYKKKILYRHNAKPLICFDPSTTHADSKWSSNNVSDIVYNLFLDRETALSQLSSPQFSEQTQIYEKK